MTILSTNNKQIQLFIDSAENRNTSVELMQAILNVAQDNVVIADRIWTYGPTDAELCAIIEIVTNNGMYDTDEFCWGVHGYNWTDQ